MTKKADQNIQVDIVSDIVCPWCWLGARYFHQAAKQSEHKVQLTWRPYMLDPNVREGGMNYAEYMRAKFGGGSSDKFKPMRDHLEQAAPQVGITFKFDDIPMRPNTLNAHRLMHWASGQGLATEASEALFAAFFDRLEDVGAPGVLAEIAGDIGLDKSLVAELLASDKDKAKVNDEITYFRSLGVSGVPTFIYQGQFAVQGAQPVEVHVDAMEKAASLIS